MIAGKATRQEEPRERASDLPHRSGRPGRDRIEVLGSGAPDGRDGGPLRPPQWQEAGCRDLTSPHSPRRSPSGRSRRVSWPRTRPPRADASRYFGRIRRRRRCRHQRASRPGRGHGHDQRGRHVVDAGSAPATAGAGSDTSGAAGALSATAWLRPSATPAGPRLDTSDGTIRGDCDAAGPTTAGPPTRGAARSHRIRRRRATDARSQPTSP